MLAGLARQLHCVFEAPMTAQTFHIVGHGLIGIRPAANFDL
jgi:hypothetical protein